MTWRNLFLILCFVGLLGVGFLLMRCTMLSPAVVNSSAHSEKETKQAPTFDLHRYSTADPTSLWIIVNKQHPLDPKNYVPWRLVVPAVPLRVNISGDERQVSNVMAPALEAMISAAKNDGLTLNLQSGYRSYQFQVSLYNYYLKRDGQVQADRESARPGYSEHQTGLAADLGGTSNPSCNVAQCFASTPEGIWLAAHAYQYGFLVRYQADTEAITGYEYEPWHVRFVGILLAAEMHTKNVTTLEELFGVSGGATYTL